MCIRDRYSAISIKHLGEYCDIHCGGIDNAFPHHTNEIAQSEAYLGHEWCNQWFHVLHLNDETGKMSKSKGEFLTVSLLEDKGYNPVVYRFFCLQSHYRKTLTFSFEALDNATVAYNKLIAKIAALKADDSQQTDKAALEVLREKFNKAMCNDLNTSLAITALYDVLKYKTNDKTKLLLLDEFDQVLSLDLLKAAAEVKKKAEEEAAKKLEGVDPEILALVEERTAAKKAKNFARADEIRDMLKERGITLKDTPQGVEIIKE